MGTALPGDQFRAIAARTLDEHLTERAANRPGEIVMSFMDYSSDRAGRETPVTFGELDAAVTRAAGRIARVAPRGARMVILSPQGLGYVTAFLGALRAGVVAVPLFPPDLIGHGDRLTAVVDDCEPACVATTSGALPAVEAYLRTRPRPLPICVVDGPGEPPADTDGPEAPPGPAPARRPRPELDDIAYIQYTSGSTRTPSGVLISHRNVVSNTAQAITAYRCEPSRNTIVSWLPLFHDMGLVLLVGGTVAGGIRAVFMDPVAFLQRPVRWLAQLAANPGAVTMAPNFAFDFAAERVREKDRAGLRLGGVWVMVNGAEPVRPATLTRFVETFGPLGLRPEALCPSYGLAEATVYVCGAASGVAQLPVLFDAAALATGTAVPVEATEQGGAAGGEGAARVTALLSCGVPVGQHIAIVDPQSRQVCPVGTVGEIWTRGPNVARAYHQQPDRSAVTFGQRLARPPDAPPAAPSTDTGTASGTGTAADTRRVAVLPADWPRGGWQEDGWQEDGWLRTGDLGMVHDGALYVTGRLKDLIVIDGRNHYPQDIEATVEAAHEAVRPNRTAAFTVLTERGEAVVVATEVDVTGDDQLPETKRMAGLIRGAVAVNHGLAVHDVVLTRPGAVPLTSSGKIARHACRERYLAGTLVSTAGTSR
ncbi:fatty acyl-AMP ligase [Frankia sp. EI5c]|uniref:fatty acyl-AMP ligase n=1 Tax=Frankia sp. EI5c TaxID=683316 RepID=UPI000825FF2B|nr:fatty acyl-AMP ligase [Frankia sp. EI5c]